MLLRLKIPLYILGVILAFGYGVHSASAQIIDPGYFKNFQVVSKTTSTAVIGWDTTAADGQERINYGTVVNQLNFGPANEATPGGTAHTANLGVVLPAPGAPTDPNKNLALVQGQAYLFEVIGQTKKSGQKAFFFGDVSFTNIQVVEITTTSAKVQFTTNFDVCAILNYGTSAATMNTQIQECPTPEVSYTPSQTHSIALTGLTPETSYYFNLGYFGASVTTPPQSFTTLSESSGTALPTSSEYAAITSINITQVSSTDASVTFSYSAKASVGALQYQVVYGRNVKYTSPMIPPKSLPGAFGNAAFSLSGLTPNTTYHFSIQLCSIPSPAGNCKDILVVSADRAFTTAATGGSSSGVLVDRIRTDCINTSCVVYFATNQLATVTVCWSPSVLNSFPSGTCTAESADGTGFRSLRIPKPSPPVFSSNTTYHYRLQAIAPSTASFTTGDLTLVTSANSSDHVFATGSCTSGVDTVDIGSCLGTKLCTSGGVLLDDCTKCGSVCPALYTCRSGVSGCQKDPELNGSPSQCNESMCYSSNRNLINPAPAKCYASWTSCNANTILKVRNDRGCNVWLTCETSIQKTVSATGPAENLCLSLGACNSLNTKGQCNNYLPPGQCDNDPLRFCYRDTDCQGSGTCNSPEPDAPTKALKTMTYIMPKDQTKLADLSGNVVAGIDWGLQGGANVIQGQLPWQLMRQIGGVSQIVNGDFERRAPEVTPWVIAPPGDAGRTTITVDFEEKNSGPNHILKIEPDVSLPFTGAVSGVFTTSASEYYYAEARIKADTGSPRVQLRFGFDNYTTFQVTNKNCSNDVSISCAVNADCGAGNTCNDNSVKTLATITATAAWQRVTIGPIKGMVGATRVGVVCADPASCSAFEVDDVQVKPILQIDTNPNYVTPSCRLYPKNDSPACDYVDANDVQYRGWHGYCLEHDSQTGTCLSWWPVDIIRGDDSLFGAEKTAGYSDRTPLFLCAESAGRSIVDGRFTVSPYIIRPIYSTTNGTCWRGGAACNKNSDCPWPVAFCRITGGYTLQCPYQNPGPVGVQAATGGDNTLTEADIQGVIWHETTGDQMNLYLYNTDEFQQSNRTESIKYLENQDPNKPYWVYRTTAPIGTDKGTINPDSDVAWVIYGAGCNLSLKTCVAAAVLLFDKNTGLLKSYYLSAWPTGINNSQPFSPAFNVTFYLRETCNKIVQVVSPDGLNQTYAQRVKSSTYTVPGPLNYGRTVDLPPFGGVLSPDTNLSDPTKWPILGAETRSLAYDLPGQARSGAPYACKDDCTTYRCQTKVLASQALISNCANASDVKRCQQIDSDQDGTPDGVCVGVTPPTLSPASAMGGQVTGLHDPTKVDPVADKAYFAQERMRRLFAKSFGVWEMARDSGGSRYDSYSLVSSVKSGFFSTTWTVTIQCKSNQTHLQYDAGPPIACNPTPCTTFSNQGGKAKTLAGAIAQAYAKCKGQVACPNDLACVESTGHYILRPAEDWNGPTEICQKDAASGKSERGKFPLDFCAVPPKITNIGFVNSSEKEITLLGGNGQVSIKFNTEVDAEQVPLNQISIDWGVAGEDPQVIPFPFAPHNDPSNPHIFTRAYKCPKKTSCQFHIKLQVIDNWGWGNDAVKNGDPILPDSFDPDDPKADTPSQDDSANWEPSVLTVNVDG